MHKTEEIKPSTVGMEIELGLYFPQRTKNAGYIANVADGVLRKYIMAGQTVREAHYAQVEYNSPPVFTLKRLHELVLTGLRYLELASYSQGVVPISVSEFGAGEAVLRRGNKRYDAYIDIIGRENDRRLKSLSGVHANFSQYTDRKIQQYWLLYALESLSYALTSTYPIKFDGSTGLNNNRTAIIRREAFVDFPLHAQLQEYPESIDDLRESNEERFLQWQKASGIDMESFRKLFNPENTGYQPIRMKTNFLGTGINLWEVRGFDTAPLPVVMGAVALYKGVYDRSMRDGVYIAIAENDNEYMFSENGILLPNLATLKGLEDESISYGLRSRKVRKYLSAVLEFAEPGLHIKDKMFLDSVKTALSTELNPADILMDFMRENVSSSSIFTPDQAAIANLYMRNLYRSGLN